MKCAVVIPIGPGHELLAEDARESAQAAFDGAPGPFSELSLLCVDDTRGALGRSAARNEGVRRARRDGAQWIFFLDADDVMHPAAFDAFKPHVASFDAVWGAICEMSDDEEHGIMRAGQVLEIDNVAQILSYDPWLTLQMGHFVKTEIALATPFAENMDAGEDFDYYLRVWTQHKCIKVPTPLFINRRGSAPAGPRRATPREWREAAQAVIARCCETLGFHSEFELEGEAFRFFIADPFDAVQRCHLKRRYFEGEELRFVRDRVGRGSVIVEIGANVGNHVVYYARFMQPSKIIVIEPNPASIVLLKKNLAANHVACADLSLLDSAGGPVRRPPMERLSRERVDFMKIDVEGAELQVLEEAQALMQESRPGCLVKVYRKRLPSFNDWIETSDYRVVRTFDYVDAVNLFIEPH